MDVEAEVDRVFGLPLGEFTAARDALAKELRSSGGADEAKRIKALRKPSVAVWALNQLSRREPDALRELLEAGERLRREQRKAMSGGKAAGLREAGAARERAVERLVRAAEAILTDADHAASAGTLAKVRDALTAVATDEAGAEVLARGRLERELRPAGFVDVGAMSVLEGEAEEEPAAPPEGDALAEARKRAEEASRAAVEAEREAMRRSDAAEKAEHAVANARRRVDEAERALRDMRKEAERAEGKLAEARRGAEEAEAEAAARRREAEDTAAELERLTSETGAN